jgi:2-amino-4-hydroxy-6-hydroxymethyldihydropteridine diphosphokinase
MLKAYVSIGSNIDRDQHIPSSLSCLSHDFGRLNVSSLYESEAVGFESDAFYNLVVSFVSDLAVAEIAAHLRRLELAHGRQRHSQKFSARTLDLDLILYGDLIVNDGGLQIPRAEIEHYAFVLEPLAEIAPQQIHPVLGQSYAHLWANFDKTHLHQHRVYPPWLAQFGSTK